MAITGKFEVDIEIKSCGDLFHELFGQKPHEVANVIPDMVASCDVHEGEFGQPGSIIYWNYTQDGKKCVAKDLVEEIDVENKFIKFKLIEGDLLEGFKNITFTVYVIQNDETTVVKWTVYFEKIHEDGPFPTKIMELFVQVTKGVEASHLAAESQTI